jgi:hypothetical protein
MSTGMIKYLGLAALGIFIGSAIASPGYAANEYTCIGEVYYKIGAISGAGNLFHPNVSYHTPTTPGDGRPTGSHPTVTASASKCHGMTYDEFKANTAWSNSKNVCERLYKEHKVSGALQVTATDYFLEMGHTRGYNRVAYYQVKCDEKGNSNPVATYPPLTNTPITVVPNPLP